MKFGIGILFSFVLALAGSLQGQVLQIQVSTYGAHPDDGLDDIDGIRKAFKAIPHDAPFVEIVFEAGVYDLNARTKLGLPKAGQTLFSFYNESFRVGDLTIAGNGAILVGHGFNIQDPIGQSWYTLFHINGGVSTSAPDDRFLDLHIQDLTITMSRLPYSMGSCTNVYKAPSNQPLKSSYFDVLIDPYFTDISTSMSVEMLTHYPTPGHPGGFEFFYVQDLSPSAVVFLKKLGYTPGGQVNEYRFSGDWSLSITDPQAGKELLEDLPGSQSPPIEHGKLYVNDRVLFLHHYGGDTAISAAACKSIEVVNTTIHHWAGMGIGIHYSSNLSFIGVTIAPDPQRAPSYPMSTTSDGIHLRAISGTVDLHDCVFAGMGDDAFNIYTPMDNDLTCFDTENNILEAHCKGACIYKAGDLFEFSDEEGKPIYTDTLKKVLTPVCGNPNQVNRLQFTNPFPAGVTLKYLCDLNQYPTSVHIQNCTVDRNQGNGFLVRRNATIDNCSVVGAPATGVTVGPSVGFWNEGPSGKQVVISYCIFSDLCYGDGFGHPWEGAITIGGFRLLPNNGPWTYGSQGCVDDVLIDHCEFSSIGGTNVVARSTNTVTIQNCAFGDCSYWGSLLTYPAEAKKAAESLLFFSKTGSVSILNNILPNWANYINLDRWEGAKPSPYVLSGNSWQ